MLAYLLENWSIFILIKFYVGTWMNHTFILMTKREFLDTLCAGFCHCNVSNVFVDIEGVASASLMVGHSVTQSLPTWELCWFSYCSCYWKRRPLTSHGNSLTLLTTKTILIGFATMSFKQIKICYQIPILPTLPNTSQLKILLQNSILASEWFLRISVNGLDKHKQSAAKKEPSLKIHIFLIFCLMKNLD